MTVKSLRCSIRFFCLLLLTFKTTFSFGQVQSQVIVPSFDDDFSKTVQQLENGQTDIDYLAFRYSFIESEQFRVASGKLRELDSLKKAMYGQMAARSTPPSGTCPASNRPPTARPATPAPNKAFLTTTTCNAPLA